MSCRNKTFHTNYYFKVHITMFNHKINFYEEHTKVKYVMYPNVHNTTHNLEVLNDFIISSFLSSFNFLL